VPVGERRHFLKERLGDVSGEQAVAAVVDSGARASFISFTRSM